MSILDLFRRGKRVDLVTQRARLAVCKLCPDRKGPVCGVCGCVLKAKAKLVTEDCPRDRWPG